MQAISYSFCMSLLHSLWQSALLWLVFILAEKILSRQFTPGQKKNLLFVSIIVQFCLFIITFIFYQVQPAGSVSNLLYNTGLYDILGRENLDKYSPWLFAVYLTVLSFKIVKSFAEWFLFKKQFRTGLVKPNIDLRLFTLSRQYHFGIKRKVQLWLSHTISSPLTFGFFKPVIVLPVALVNQLSMQQAETLILHELAHIKANDFLFNWLLIAAETVFFFNPFILSLCKKIKLEREKNCDITVTAFSYPAVVYAETLLKAQTVKQLAHRQQFEGYRIAAVQQPQQLLQRIQFFVNPANQMRQQKKRLLLPLLSLAMLAVITPAVLLQVQQRLAQKKQDIVFTSPQILLKNSDGALPVIVNNVLKLVKPETINKITAAVEKQQPLIEKKIKELEPLLQEMQEQAGLLHEKMATENALLTPVAYNDNSASAKQIVIREEQSGSKNAVLKVYNVIFKDGKWILQPQWKLAAKEINLADSLQLSDSSAPPAEDTELQD